MKRTKWDDPDIPLEVLAATASDVELRGLVAGMLVRMQMLEERLDRFERAIWPMSSPHSRPDLYPPSDRDRRSEGP